MKIGLISGEFPPMPGGVGDFTRLLAERLLDHGHDVHVLSRPRTGHDALQVSAVDGWGLGSLPAIRRWVQQRDLSLVNLQFQTAAYNMSPFIHFLPDALAAPLVTTFHDLRHPYLFPKAGPLRDWFVMRLARASAGVITTNPEDDHSLRELPKRRIIPLGSSVVSPGCGESDAEKWRRRLGADVDSFVLGHFGFLKAVKGIDDLLDALANLRAAGRDLRLLFIGGRGNLVDNREDAAYLRRLEQRIQQLGLADGVAFTGYLPDCEVAACFRAVDLVTLPFSDGASYRRSSLIAAIHNGCAILTTEPRVEADSFAHGRNLWLVPPRSSDALEDAICQLMNDGDQLRRLRAGATRLSARFDWDEIAFATVDFFQSLV